MKPKRSHQQDKLARLYDAEILPVWSQRFGRMLLRDLVVPQKASVLDVSCATGYPALEVIRRMDEGRIIALDSSSAMLDVAREKAGALSGRRIFFRSDSPTPRLAFDADVYDLVLSNLGLAEVEDPMATVADLARVTKPGGRLVATLPLEGTFAEFYDIFREVLIKRDKVEALARLEKHLEHQPTPDRARGWFGAAGLLDITVEEERFTLLFKSSREFFYAPVIEYGELSRWKEIAGTGTEMQEVFRHIKEAIDAYFGARSFAVTAVAGCIRARKPLDEERRALGSLATTTGPVRDDAPTSPMPPMSPATTPMPPARGMPAASEVSTGGFELGTGEIEVVSERDGDDFDDDDDDQVIP